jgi:excisionase family DNA binding protein
MNHMSPKELAALLAGPTWAQFPDFLTPDHVAALLSVPKATVYTWSSQGLLDACKVRVGKHVRFLRAQFVQIVISGGLNGN